MDSSDRVPSVCNAIAASPGTAATRVRTFNSSSPRIAEGSPISFRRYFDINGRNFRLAGPLNHLVMRVAERNRDEMDHVIYSWLTRTAPPVQQSLPAFAHLLSSGCWCSGDNGRLRKRDNLAPAAHWTATGHNNRGCAAMPDSSRSRDVPGIPIVNPAPRETNSEFRRSAPL